MKRRTINLVICNKFKAWANSIEDLNVRELVEKNTICTGGSIASMLMGEEANDFDFYFRNKETAAAVARYYVHQFVKNPSSKFKSQYTGKVAIYVQTDPRVKIVVKSAGVVGEEGTSTYQYFEGLDPNDPSVDQYIHELKEEIDSVVEETKDAPKYRPIFLTANAITLTEKIQLILRFYGEPNELHDNYDFVHCTNYWDSALKKVELRTEALESILTKELRYVGSKYPLCSMFRLRKFINRGWTITAGHLLKIGWQINELNLKDFDVLEEQLVGVDTAYFLDLITKLKDKGAETVDSNYLMQIIDSLL